MVSRYDISLAFHQLIKVLMYSCNMLSPWKWWSKSICCKVHCEILFHCDADQGLKASAFNWDRPTVQQCACFLHRDLVLFPGHDMFITIFCSTISTNKIGTFCFYCSILLFSFLGNKLTKIQNPLCLLSCFSIFWLCDYVYVSVSIPWALRCLFTLQLSCFCCVFSRISPLTIIVLHNLTSLWLSLDWLCHTDGVFSSLWAPF